MIEYCTIERNGLYDFRQVILPNIMEQLLAIEDFDSQGIRLVGALDGETPVGALAARFLENQEVFLHSLYVLPEHQHQGIGSELLKAICMMASEEYPICFAEDFPLFLHAEYTLPEEDCSRFQAFLKKQGFTDFLDMSDTYLFEKEDLEAALRTYTAKTSGIKCLTDSPEYDAELFRDAFDHVGFEGDPAFCFYHEGEEEADFMACVTPGEEGDYYLYSTDGGNDTDPKACSDTCTALLQALCKEKNSLSLIVDGESNLALPLWEELAAHGGIVCKRQEAGMYIVFEE